MYPLQTPDDNSYVFDTDLGYLNLVGFSKANFRYDDTCLLRDRVEEVLFEPFNIGSRGYDKKVSTTIIEIIRQRCRENAGAVLFICSSEDKRHFGRSKLFARWNAEFNIGEFYYESVTLTYSDSSIYAGIIIELSNINLDKFVSEFKYTYTQIEGKQY